MIPKETPRGSADGFYGRGTIGCDACESALQSPGRRELSFLLLDGLTVALVGCDAHVEQFTSVCGLTTEGTADLLEHRPAGGISCPGCRLAPSSRGQPVLPVQHGAVAVLACPDHQAEMVSRFRTGLETREQLTASLDTGE